MYKLSVLVMFVAAATAHAYAAFATPSSISNDSKQPALAQPPSTQHTSQSSILQHELITAQESQPCCLLPALTPLTLKVMEDLSSKTSKIGDPVTLELANPIIVKGKTLVPAGTPATAEVIDVQHIGFGGKPGSMIVAARYLKYRNMNIPLRSFQLGGVGKDNMPLSTAVGLAAGMVGLLITGRNYNVPKGALASAKIREDIILPPVPDEAVDSKSTANAAPTSTISTPTKEK
jgi:hypothetical protein